MFLVGYVTVSAQETQPATTSSSGTSDMHTLFHKGDGTHKVPVGFFFELNSGYTHFGHKSAMLPGMSMGILLNHHWTIGLSVSMISTMQGDQHHHNPSVNDSLGDPKHHNNMSNASYGGLLLEYTLLPMSRVHVSFPLLIGCGSASFEHHGNPADTLVIENQDHHQRYHTEHFFVIEPGVKLEINVVKHLRIGLGLSYRYTPGREYKVTSPDMLNQLTGKISLRFGKFE